MPQRLGAPPREGKPRAMLHETQVRQVCTCELWNFSKSLAPQMHESRAGRRGFRERARTVSGSWTGDSIGHWATVADLGRVGKWIVSKWRKMAASVACGAFAVPISNGAFAPSCPPFNTICIAAKSGRAFKCLAKARSRF
jgi:hypothetical protein